MHEQLWAAVESKLGNAEFHRSKMNEAVVSHQERHAGDNRWLESLTAHLDAFLTCARSVPMVIGCLFGKDTMGDGMEDWFKGLSTDEQDRRRDFKSKFQSVYQNFKDHDLTKARDISVHRGGTAPLTIRINRFGVELRGTPTEPIIFTDKTQFMRVGWQDIMFGEKNLFEQCREYLDLAKNAEQAARTIVSQVHGGSVLSSPPP
jgi:hypothetical protein